MSLPVQTDPVVLTPPAEPLLVLRDIVRTWGGRPVLNGATVQLRPGRVAWLGGSNGAGKTTLLRIAAGLVAPEGGDISLDGLHPERDRRAFQRALGFLAAGDRGLYARLSVQQNLEFWTGLAMLERRRRRPAVDRVVAMLGLEALREHRVDRLSMGQRQRVRLAMAFLHEPRVMLLDEPHTSLDDAGVQLLREVLETHVAAGGAALWCAPALNQADLPHDDAWVLRDGVVVPA
jgi:heme ABC exporter ATP-binding subunit CcmA